MTIFCFLPNLVSYDLTDQISLIDWVLKDISINFLKCQSRLQQMTNFVTSILILEKIKQMILEKYHALFVVFEKAAKFEIVVCCTL